MTPLPHEAIAQARDTDLVLLADSYGVKMDKQGKDFFGLCPFHSESSPSFTVYRKGGHDRYHCMGCGADGDAIQFVQDYESLCFRDAVKRLVGELPASGASPTPAPAAPREQHEEEWAPIMPIPDSAPLAPDTVHRKIDGKWVKLQLARRWGYRNESGAVLGYVCRFNLPCGGKEVVPLVWAVSSKTGECRWRWLSFPKPRPLYGLDRLAANPNAQVIIVEGEKAADAGQERFLGLGIPMTKLIVMAWPGGGKAVKHVDFSPLAGRSVGLWPDADQQIYPERHERAGVVMPFLEQPGTVAMLDVWKAIRDSASSVKMILPPEGVEDGWDLADALPQGFSLVVHVKNSSVGPATLRQVSEPAVSENDRAPGAGAPMQLQLRQSKRPQGDQTRPQFGAPIDIFNSALPPQVPLRVLPDPIAAYAKDQAGLLGGDHSILGMTALVASAALIDDGIKIQPKRMDPTWTESARLWVAVVGDPSTKKSPSISKAVLHVKRIEARLSDVNAAAYSDWKYRHEQWKAAKKGREGQDVPPEPEQPPIERLLVEDTTVEALSEVLKDNPRGVLCLQDELTGWFASMDAYKGGGGKGANKDRAHWLEIFNGGRKSIDRVTRGSVVVSNWSACMIGGIQPEMMRRIANGMGNDGLLQRFMVVVARSARKGEDRHPDHRSMERFSALFDQLEALSPSEQPVRMTEEAHQVRERIEAFAEKMIRAFDHPHMQAWLGKWEGLFARLVLTYHVIECAEENVYPNATLVRGEVAAKVEGLMCGVLLHHAIYFYNEIVDAHDRYTNMRQLARLILSRGMHLVTKRDLAQYWRASRKLQQWEVKGVIDSLCSMDWLYPDEMSIDATDGRPRAWFVNPAVHEVFAQHAQSERARREEVVEAMREIRRAYPAEV